MVISMIKVKVITRFSGHEEIVTLKEFEERFNAGDYDSFNMIEFIVE